MARKNKKKIPKWNVGKATISLTSNNTYALHIRPMRGDTPVRKRFKSLEQAVAYVEQGILPAVYDKADASLAASLLPDGVSLTDCVRYYLNNNDCARVALLQDVRNEYLDAVKANLRPRTYQSYVVALNKFVESVGNLPVNAITSDVVEASLAGKTAYARNGSLRVISAFMGWCVRKGYCNSNCCTKLQLSRTTKSAPVALSIADCKRLLDECVKLKPSLVAYFTLGLFAGLRPQEVLRLPKSAIGTEYITIDATVAKTADARTVPIRDNLRAWLAKYPLDDRVLNATAIKRLKTDLTVAIPHDALRHSYATYAYEQCKDAALVASEMGHQGTAVFFKHYRALAMPGDGDKWFSIRPSS